MRVHLGIQPRRRSSGNPDLTCSVLTFSSLPTLSFQRFSSERYGFYKVNKTNRSTNPANISNSSSNPQGKFSEGQVWEFSHPKFLRGRPDLLDDIKRRVPMDEMRGKDRGGDDEDREVGSSSTRRVSGGVKSTGTGSKESNSGSRSSGMPTPNTLPVGLGIDEAEEPKESSRKVRRSSSDASSSWKSKVENEDANENEDKEEIRHDQSSNRQFGTTTKAGLGVFPQSKSLPSFPQTSNVNETSFNHLHQYPQNPIHQSQPLPTHPSQLQYQHSQPTSDAQQSYSQQTPQNYHLGQAVFQMRDNLVGLVNWIQFNRFNDGRLPFDIRIPSEEMLLELLGNATQEVSKRESHKATSFGGGMVANSPGEIPGSAGIWENGIFHQTNPQASQQPHLSQEGGNRPEIYVTAPNHLDNRTSSTGSWSNSSYSGNDGRRISDSMSGEGVGIGILDANGRSIDPYSGRSNMKRSHHGLTINTSNPASNSTDSQMSSYPTSSSSLGSHSHSMDESDHMHSHQGLAGVGLMRNFNTNMFNAVNTPLPPSPAVQTPNSAISNHFMFQHLNNQQVDSPITPICPQFVHQDGFGGNHFSNNNSNQSLTLVDGSNAFNHQINGMDHHHHHHLQQLHPPRQPWEKEPGKTAQNSTRMAPIPRNNQRTATPATATTTM